MREHSQGRPVRLSDDEWDVIDEAARGLEELWQSSGGAELSRFLPPPDHPLRLRVLFELIKLDPGIPVEEGTTEETGRVSSRMEGTWGQAGYGPGIAHRRMSDTGVLEPACNGRRTSAPIS